MLKLTLHGGILREHTLSAAVHTLKALQSEGKVELFESDRAKEAKAVAYGWPGGTPSAPPARRYRSQKRHDPAGGPSFQMVSLVLFPHRDPHRLDLKEINDVSHLLRHVSLKHEIFVTTDTANFISGGRRERLLSAFKIVVLTPDETVAAVRESQQAG